MEPIELSGKTFCSNCGLTIGNLAAKDPIAKITNSLGPTAPTFSDISAAVAATPQFTTAPATPIMDEARDLLGINKEASQAILVEPPQTATAGSIIDSPSDLGAVKVRITDSESTNDLRGSGRSSQFNSPTPTDIIQEIDGAEATVDDVKAELETAIPEDITTTEAIDPVPAQNDDSIPPLGQSIDMPDESDFDITPMETSDTSTVPVNLEAKVKEVDTLGASGILLDILNENYQMANREEAVHALEAAEELIDKVEIAEDTEAIETKEELISDILKDQPQNPVEFPEITSPLDEPEIEAPKVVTAIDTNIDNDIATPAMNVTKTATSSDDVLYKLPHELAGMANPHSPEETIENIEEVKHELAHMDNASIPDGIKNSHYYDPDTIDEVVASPTVTVVPEPAPTKEDATIEPKEEVVTAPEKPAVNSELKQEVVKSFLKAKIEKPKKKSFFWQKPKEKTKKKDLKPKKIKTEESTPKDIANTKPGTGFKFNKKWALSTLVIIVIFALALVVFFAYRNYQLPAEQNTRTTEKASTVNFESLVPAEAPIGYEMTSSNFDEGLNKLTIRYSFVNDKNKTLSYTQTPLKATGIEGVNEYIKSKDGETYVTKDQSGVTFTEFTNGTLVWTNDKFLFTIEAQGYDLSHDLIYNMALSLG